MLFLFCPSSKFLLRPYDVTITSLLLFLHSFMQVVTLNHGRPRALSSHVRDRVVVKTTQPFALASTAQTDTCAMTTQPFAWDRTTQPFTCRDRRIIIQTFSPFPPPFPAFEGIILFMPNYNLNISTFL